MKPLTPNMAYLIRRTVAHGLSDSGIWAVATRRHGPAGYNVIEGLLRRDLLDYFPGNNGTPLRATYKARQWVADNPEEAG